MNLEGFDDLFFIRHALFISEREKRDKAISLNVETKRKNCERKIEESN